MSFITSTNAIKVRLENNQALKEFCAANFSKQLKVLKAFKKKKEIGLDEFPLMLITRPQKKYISSGGASKTEHSVLLYGGFREEDAEKAFDLSIQFEELTGLAVITKTQVTGDIGMAISVEDMANDEGVFHPVYFFVMHVKVKDR